MNRFRSPGAERCIHMPGGPGVSIRVREEALTDFWDGSARPIIGIDEWTKRVEERLLVHINEVNSDNHEERVG